jgi:hypothetical protein
MAERVCMNSHVALRKLSRLWIRKYEASEFSDEVAQAAQAAKYKHRIAELVRNSARLMSSSCASGSQIQTFPWPQKGGLGMVSFG